MRRGWGRLSCRGASSSCPFGARPGCPEPGSEPLGTSCPCCCSVRSQEPSATLQRGGGGGGGGGGFIHRLLKRSAASATPQSPGWEGRQRGGKAAPRACGRDRLPPSPGTPTSRRFFLTSKYQSAWGQPRSPFSGSLRNIAQCARKLLPSHPSPPPLPRPPRCQCWLRGKEPPGSCGAGPQETVEYRRFFWGANETL